MSEPEKQKDKLWTAQHAAYVQSPGGKTFFIIEWLHFTGDDMDERQLAISEAEEV